MSPLRCSSHPSSLFRTQPTTYCTVVEWSGLCAFTLSGARGKHAPSFLLWAAFSIPAPLLSLSLLCAKCAHCMHITKGKERRQTFSRPKIHLKLKAALPESKLLRRSKVGRQRNLGTSSSGNFFSCPDFNYPCLTSCAALHTKDVGFTTFTFPFQI